MRLTFGASHSRIYGLGFPVKTKMKRPAAASPQAEAASSLPDSRRGWDFLSMCHLISSRFNLAQYTSGQSARQPAYRWALSRRLGPRTDGRTEADHPRVRAEV